MSTCYWLYGKAFDFDALKTEGPKVGMFPESEEEHNDDKSQCYRVEVNGRPVGYLWAFRWIDGIATFTRYGDNFAAVEGLERLAEAIGADLVSEHDDIREVAIKWRGEKCKPEDNEPDIEQMIEELPEEDEFNDYNTIWWDEIYTEIPGGVSTPETRVP